MRERRGRKGRREVFHRMINLDWRTIIMRGKKKRKRERERERERDETRERERRERERERKKERQAYLIFFISKR